MYECKLKCILPLLGVYIMFHSVLKHIATTGMHTISRQFIPLIYAPLELEYVLTYNIICPFINVKSCYLVILPISHFKNYIRVYICMTITYLKHV